MLMKVIGSVPGYAELLASAKEQSSALAAIPPGAPQARTSCAAQLHPLHSFAEVYHWEGVEAFQERKAHETVKRALLDVESGAQCVVAHGMGGTGTHAAR